MAVLFADVPQALPSPVEIAERCSFRPVTRKPILPRFTVGAGSNAADAESGEAAELRRQAEEGLSYRLRVHGLAPGESEEDYRARLAFELDVITRMNYAGYFLIVADFIKWAKAEGIPVGPGRGSGAGSLVAYALTITDLDPLRFGLIFERFLNPERVSMPDFDIDFCQDRRDEVIRYVQGRYGRDQVAQIITFGTLQARGVLRDVGRVLQMPYGQVDKLCKLVPQNALNPVKLGRAIDDEPRLQAERDRDEVVRRGFEVDLTRIPLDDAKTYEMLARGETVGVFQVESQGMRRALVDMRPDRFTDIIALVALYRPGPMANIPTYCARKQGLEQPDYIHPKLEPILRETYGVIVYQEQVMQAAQVLSGYSLGEADLLRRAMGKKIRSEMKAQQKRFVSGAVERGVEPAQAEAIFELVERFADYGFNKSHAAAYALVAYQTAYMKANFPVEFLAASMTLDMSNTDKLAEFRAEAQRLRIKVVPPSVNRSGVHFEVDGNAIHYALAALKGVGSQAVEAIVAARGERPFADLADFAGRIPPRAVNKRVLESLAAAGAFDALESNRASVFAAVDVMLATAQRTHDAVSLGQSELFGGPSARAPLALSTIEP